jgi:hypothetical protein
MVTSLCFSVLGSHCQLSLVQIMAYCWFGGRSAAVSVLAMIINCFAIIGLVIDSSYISAGLPLPTFISTNLGIVWVVTVPWLDTCFDTNHGILLVWQ